MLCFHVFQYKRRPASNTIGLSPLRPIRRSFAATMIIVVLLPMILSPTHPVAVYGYLISVYFPTLSSPVYAATEGGLAEFLVAPEQVERYRASLLEDISDTVGGHIFAVTCDQRGILELSPIRTWNSLLPRNLPSSLAEWLDRKEFPLLADEVAIWLDGKRIVAMGHYHVFGGPPSRGDQLAQLMTPLPEIVVANGVIPLVYLRGELLLYGEGVEVTREVFRAMRAVESGLAMDIAGLAIFSSAPSPVVETTLAYLRDHRNVDISQRQAIARELETLCIQFKREYSTFFQHGYTLSPYAENPDYTRMLQNLAALHGWATLQAAS